MNSEDRVEMMKARLLNPVFSGRTDWLLRWDKATCRFEQVNVHHLMMLMACRDIKQTLEQWVYRVSRLGKGMK